MTVGFPTLGTPPIGADGVPAWLRKVYEVVSGIRKGKIDCVTTLTLTANSATTVLTDNRLSAQSVVCFDPKTAHAATELAAGTMYVLTANRGQGVWTVTNANNAEADREFAVSILG